MEYSGTTWDPYIQTNKDKLEKVSRSAATCVAKVYGQRSSVSTELKKLDWPSLKHRRQNQCLVVMFKVVHNLVVVPSTSHPRRFMYRDT